jgi:hypothetical protein
MLVSYLLYSSTLKMEAQLIFSGLNGVIFQKIELFITSAVRASDPT